MRGGERPHRARPDHGGGASLQGGVGRPPLGAVEPLGGDVQRDRHHTAAGGVDRGLRVHPLADRQRPLGQIVQGAPDGPVALGGGVGAPHLAEDLLLAHHRAVQAAGHREEVFDGGLAVAHVGVLSEIPHRHPGVVGENLTDRRQSAVEGVDHGVDLDAVARRQHHRLGHQRRLQHFLDQFRLIGVVGGELLENRDRRAAVRHPEQQDAHDTTTLMAPSNGCLRTVNSAPGVKLLETVNASQRPDQIARHRHRPAMSARNRSSSTSQ